MLVMGMSFLRSAADLSRPIKGPFSGSRVGNIDSFIMRLRACIIKLDVSDKQSRKLLTQKVETARCNQTCIVCIP